MALTSKNTLVKWAKLLIGLACLGLIAQRLYISYSSENISSVKEIFTAKNSLYILLAFLLLFFNWGIEVFKWKTLTNNIEQLSFSKLWQSVWTGVCIGNLTPARLGEFAGRVLYFKPQHRAEVSALHFVGSFAQLIITIVMGCIGLLGFSTIIDAQYFSFILISELVLLVIISLILFRINRVIKWVKTKSFFKKYDFSDIKIDQKTLFQILLLSFFRYLFFWFQFYLLLTACGVQGNLLEIGGAITVAYLLLSTIPMISFIEVAIRAFIVVLLFGNLGSNDWKLSIASTLLWLINIVFPSVIGYIFLVRNKFSFSQK